MRIATVEGIRFTSTVGAWSFGPRLSLRPFDWSDSIGKSRIERICNIAEDQLPASRLQVVHGLLTRAGQSQVNAAKGYGLHNSEEKCQLGNTERARMDV